MARTVYRCKFHEYQHEYTVCQTCQCQYCPKYWASGCPNRSWHPAHGRDAADIGTRYAQLHSVESKVAQ